MQWGTDMQKFNTSKYSINHCNDYGRMLIKKITVYVCE